MSMRIVKSARRTDETEISLTLNLDGSGIYDVDTGCGFLNHIISCTVILLIIPWIVCIMLEFAFRTSFSPLSICEAK